MGREKDRRVKGNLQPAASSRAAELLPTSFGSFGSGDSFGAPAFGAMAEWEMAGLDGEIKVLFKRLSKRDAVTKIRALEELATHVTEADIEQVKAIVPAWVKAYNRLSVDTDRKVRELSQLVLLRILHQNKKQLAPHLRDVIGSWLCANYDPNKEVAKLAAEAFEVAFPNKRNDVLAFCQSEILSYVNENVINQTAETMSDSRYTTPEDMLAKYGRVVAGSIYILAELIEHLATTEKTKSTSQYDAILDSAKFWLLSRAELPQIRRAMYFLINTASRHAHDILQSGQRQSMVSHAFLESAFTDGEGSTQRDLREALLFYTKAFPTSWILATNKKPIAPKFLKFLRTGAHGYMNISYPYLLPLIMSLPKELLGDDTFVKDFLGSLWAGCESTSMSKPNGPILLNAYYECVLGILSHSELRPSSALTEHITKVDALRPLHFYLLGGDSAASNGKVSANDLVTLSTEHLGKMLRSSQLSPQSRAQLLDSLSNLVEQSLFDDSLKRTLSREESCARAATLYKLLSSTLTAQDIDRSKIIQDVQRIVSKLLSTTTAQECALGHPIFLRKISETFSGTLFQEPSVVSTLKSFIQDKLAQLVHDTPQSSQHYLDVIVMYISTISSADASDIQQSWKVILSVILSLPADLNVETFAAVLSEMVESCSGLKVSLQDDSSDAFVNSLLNRLAKLSSNRTDVERALAKMTILHSDLPIAQSSTMDSLLAFLQSSLHSFTSACFFMGKEEEQAAIDDLDAHNALSALRILDIVHNSAGAHGRSPVLGHDATLKSILSDVLELKAVKPPPTVHGELLAGSEAVVQIPAKAADVWRHMTSQLKQPSVLQDILTQLQEKYQNLNYCASPSAIAQQCQAIIAVDEHLQTAAVDAIIQSQNLWRDRGKEYFVELTAAENGSSQNGGNSDTDVWGLTQFGRMGATTAQLLDEQEAGNWKLDVRTLVENRHSSGWIVVELARYFVLGSKSIELGRTPSKSESHGLAAAKRCVSATIAAFVQEIPDMHAQLTSICRGLVQGKTIPITGSFTAIFVPVFRFALETGHEYIDVLRWIMSLVYEASLTTEDIAAQWLSLICEEVKDDRTLALLAAASRDTVEKVSLPMRREYIGQICNTLLQISRSAVFDDQLEKANAPLTLLNTVLGTQRDDSEFYTQNLDLVSLNEDNALTDLLRCIRGWYGNSTPRSEGKKHSSLKAQVALFIAALIGELDVGINMANFVIETSSLWIEDAAKSSDQQVFSREHLNCLLALVTAVDNAEFKSPESWNVPDKVRASTGRNLLRLFLRQEFEESSAPVGSQRISAALLGRLTQQISEDVLFEEDPSREKLYELLFAPHEDVQRCAFSLLRRLTAIFIQTTSLQVELNASKQILPPLDQPSAEDETSPDNIPAPVVAEKPVEEVREEKFPEPLALATSRVVPEHDHEPQDRQTTHANQLLGYLLSWMLLFDHFEDATFDLKSNYVSHLRQLETLPTLMQHCFVILGVGWSRAPFDLTKWDVRDYDVAGFEISSKVAFPLLAAHLYWRALRYTPSLVRNWWSECKNRQLTIAVDTYTERYFSPILIRAEIDGVTSVDKSVLPPDLVIKAAMNEVSATYTVEDATLEMVIHLPTNFPLRQVDVRSGNAAGSGGRAAGINEGRWRAWLLSASAVMVSQNGSILDAIKLFGKNISLHFEGVEDCAICYSVIGVIDRTLPTKQCKTCKHLYHSSCLFKWFKSSNQSTCPLCRQPTF